MSENCKKYEAYSMFASDEDFLKHLENCEECQKEFEKELRLSVLIQDSALEYKKLVQKNKLKKLMCKIACVFVIFSSIGVYTGFQIREHQKFEQYVQANSSISVIAQDGLPVDDCGFYDYN